jgi:hypothetical protein
VPAECRQSAGRVPAPLSGGRPARGTLLLKRTDAFLEIGAEAAVALARVRVAGFQSRSRRRRPQATATIKEVLSLKNRSAE